ncbi:MAG: hypothetical protein BWY83_02996 [bacterium ADurb.Bin478]|nr:MAG: hypothetical protein BWY83_02996 [bacterium ADurb.Bin478]
MQFNNLIDPADADAKQNRRFFFPADFGHVLAHIGADGCRPENSGKRIDCRIFILPAQFSDRLGIFFIFFLRDRGRCNTERTGGSGSGGFESLGGGVNYGLRMKSVYRENTDPGAQTFYDGSGCGGFDPGHYAGCGGGHVFFFCINNGGYAVVAEQTDLVGRLPDGLSQLFEQIFLHLPFAGFFCAELQDEHSEPGRCPVDLTQITGDLNEEEVVAVFNGCESVFSQLDHAVETVCAADQGDNSE